MKGCPKCQETPAATIGGRSYCQECLGRGTDRLLQDICAGFTNRQTFLLPGMSGVWNGSAPKEYMRR